MMAVVKSPPDSWQPTKDEQRERKMSASVSIAQRDVRVKPDLCLVLGTWKQESPESA
jgi:hypothetical protein